MADNDLTLQVTTTLRDAGKQLKADLWKAEDEAFLKARAADLIGLNAKAAAADTEAKKKAYLAAAADTVNHVKLMALIRMEVATQNILDTLGKFFLDKVVPALLGLLPKLVGMF
ncbi:MAG: hypothetical protein KF819_23875 [Labilithrix sp.]|nr:hypothetical protein [Labilithrix sp.]